MAHLNLTTQVEGRKHPRRLPSLNHLRRLQQAFLRAGFVVSGDLRPAIQLLNHKQRMPQVTVICLPV
jgi:hypothetical protein